MIGNATAVANRVFEFGRSLGYRTYFAATGLNYRYTLFARSNRTSAGEFDCYELLTRHANDPMLAEIDDVCGKSDVIYDVGANVGIYALALTSAEPRRRVVAFEPSPTVVDRLRTNVDLNDRGDSIHVAQCGLGRRTDRRPFYVSTYPELSAFDREGATRWEADVATVVSVDCSRLDDLTQALPAPDVVKLDVEGAAPNVLEGGRQTLRTHRPTVFVEVHEEGFVPDVPGNTRAILEDLEYRIRDRNRDGYWRCDPT